MATTLGFRRFLTAILAAALAAGSASPAAAGDWMPMLPDQDFYDFQLFAPPDLGDYNVYHKPHDGIFFSYDRMYLGITVPRYVPVGNTEFFPVEPLNPDIAEQLNTANGGIAGVVVYGTDPFNLDLNSTWLRTKMSWGNRYEGGWIYDNSGMFFSYFDSGPQGQNFTTINEFALNSPTQEFEQDVQGGGAEFEAVNPLVVTTITSESPPPDHLIVQNFTQRNETRIQSGAAAFIVRRQLGGRRSRSNVRVGLGPRFAQLNDRYSIGYQSDQYVFNAGSGTGTAGGQNGVLGVGDVSQNLQFGASGSNQTITGVQTLTGQGAGSPLQRGDWETLAINNIVGPELSLHLESTSGRWTFLSELRFTAGLNWQNMLYRGANFPATLAADYFRSTFVTGDVFVANANAQTVVQGTPLYYQVYGVGQQNATNAAKYDFEFTPIGEWRFGTEFRVSQAILLRAGYTGLVMGQIARASTNTSYVNVPQTIRRSVPNEAYDPNEPTGPNNPITVVEPVEVLYTRIAPSPSTLQDVVFANGVDFGIEVRY
jgi:hypothetical protein